MISTYPDTVITKENYARCYRIARQMSILSQAIDNAPYGRYLEHHLNQEYSALDDQLRSFSRGKYWDFRNMVWSKLYAKNRYENARWLENVLERTHFLERERFGKIALWLEELQGGDIPF